MCALLTHADDLMRNAALDHDALAALLRNCRGEIMSGRQVAGGFQTLFDLDDIWQDVCIDIFRDMASQGLQTTNDFVAWARAVARNTQIDYERSASAAKRPNPRFRLELGSDVDSLDALLGAAGLTSATPSRNLRRKEQSDLVRLAIDALPASEQTLIAAVYLDGQEISAVATRNGLKLGTAYARKDRGLRRLRACLLDAVGGDSSFWQQSN